MLTALETTGHLQFAVIDCLDLRPEQIDCATFAALDLDLLLGVDGPDPIESDPSPCTLVLA